jgi:hypothetical protein
MGFNPVKMIGGLGGLLSKGGGAIRDGLGGLTRRPGEEEQRQGLTDQSGRASSFAGYGEGEFGRLSGELAGETGYLRDIARGKESVTAEQLRQSLQQNLAAQQSMAAGASPQNASMAALMASRNAMQLGSGLAGQQAVAGMQERQAAQNALAQLLLQQRQQGLQAALGSRETAIGALGAITPGQSTLDQWAGPIMGGLGLATGGGGK